MDEVAEQRVLDGEAGVPPGSLTDGKLMAVQVAKNKVTPDEDLEAVKKDYVYCVDALARYADIIVVNGRLSCHKISCKRALLNSPQSVKSEHPWSKRSTACRQTYKYPHWSCSSIQES